MHRANHHPAVVAVDPQCLTHQTHRGARTQRGGDQLGHRREDYPRRANPRQHAMILHVESADAQNRFGSGLDSARAENNGWRGRPR
jgi:hypothetical protein